MSYEKHLFICTKCSFKQEGGKCSSPDIAIEFRKKVKKLGSEKFEKKSLRVNAAGCLGKCEYGISAVSYPEGEWFLGLRPGDEAGLIDKLD